MKRKAQQFFLVTMIGLAASCGQIMHHEQLSSPGFADKGHTLDSLQKVYVCESIDFENWAQKPESDSCLTVCLVNSTRVPATENVMNTVAQLKGIASAVKKALVSPEMYKRYYIIFVKKDKTGMMETKEHTAGMEIPSAEL